MLRRDPARSTDLDVMFLDSRDWISYQSADELDCRIAALNIVAQLEVETRVQKNVFRTSENKLYHTN